MASDRCNTEWPRQQQVNATIVDCFLRHPSYNLLPSIQLSIILTLPPLSLSRYPCAALSLNRHGSELDSEAPEPDASLGTCSALSDQAQAAATWILRELSQAEASLRAPLRKEMPEAEPTSPPVSSFLLCPSFSQWQFGSCRRRRRCCHSLGRVRVLLQPVPPEEKESEAGR